MNKPEGLRAKAVAYVASKRGAILAYANLKRAIFASAIFASANLTGASFTSANLTDASFASANLTDASFASANLTDASFARLAFAYAKDEERELEDSNKILQSIDDKVTVLTVTYLVVLAIVVIGGVAIYIG